MQNVKNLIEAALFIAARPMTLEELQKVKGLSELPAEEIISIIKSMESDYDHHGVRVVEEEGHYELRIKDEFTKHVEHLAPNRDFSRAILQTLSLIAYKSPVKQSEIIETRGNRAYDHIKELLERGFIRSEPAGHTNTLSITQRFLDYFNLKNTEEVKTYFAKKIAKDDKKKTAAKEGTASEEKQEEHRDKTEESPAAAEESSTSAQEGKPTEESHMVELSERQSAE